LPICHEQLRWDFVKAAILGLLLVAKIGGLLIGAVATRANHRPRLRSRPAAARGPALRRRLARALNVVQVVAPYLFRTASSGRIRHELGLYLGAVPLVLIVWLAGHGRRLGRLRPLAAGSAFSA